MAQWPARLARLRHASLRSWTPPRNVITAGSLWMAASASKLSERQPRRTSRSVSRIGIMRDHSIQGGSGQADRLALRPGLHQDLRRVEERRAEMRPIRPGIVREAVAF